MNVRAVWTGLAALFTISLGFALSLLAGSFPSWVQWLTVCVFAVAIAVAQEFSRNRAILVTIGSGIAGLVGLGLLWYLGGGWLALVIGGPVMLALTVGGTVAGPGISASVRLAIDIALLALVLPLVGFAAGGAPVLLFPWVVSAILIVPALAFLFAIHPEFLADPDPGQHERRDRLMTLGLALSGLGGVLLVGGFFPGSTEIRLLGISPAVVVAVLSLFTLLHPSAESGRRLVEVLVSVSYLSMIASLSLVYAVL